MKPEEKIIRITNPDTGEILSEITEAELELEKLHEKRKQNFCYLVLYQLLQHHFANIFNKYGAEYLSIYLKNQFEIDATHLHLREVDILSGKGLINPVNEKIWNTISETINRGNFYLKLFLPAFDFVFKNRLLFHQIPTTDEQFITEYNILLASLQSYLVLVQSNEAANSDSEQSNLGQFYKLTDSGKMILPKVFGLTYEDCQRFNLNGISSYDPKDFYSTQESNPLEDIDLIKEHIANLQKIDIDEPIELPKLPVKTNVVYSDGLDPAAEDTDILSEFRLVMRSGDNQKIFEFINSIDDDSVLHLLGQSKSDFLSTVLKSEQSRLNKEIARKEKVYDLDKITLAKIKAFTEIKKKEFDPSKLQSLTNVLGFLSQSFVKITELFLSKSLTTSYDKKDLINKLKYILASIEAIFRNGYLHYFRKRYVADPSIINKELDAWKCYLEDLTDLDENDRPVRVFENCINNYILIRVLNRIFLDECKKLEINSKI